MKYSHVIKLKLLLVLSIVIVLQSCVSKKKFLKLDNQQDQLEESLSQSRQDFQKVQELNYALEEDVRRRIRQNEILEERLRIIEAELHQLTLRDTLVFSSSSAIIPNLPGGFEDITLGKNFLKQVQYVHELESVFDKILYSQGYIKNRYFPFNGGFGIMTNIEQLHKDKTSMPEPERWNHEIEYSKSNGGGWFVNFSNSRKGRFRLFVFLITNDVYKGEKQEISFIEAEDWLVSGFGTLPTSIKKERIQITENHYCDVLVYEFEKTDSCPEGCNTSSGFTAKDHLQKAKLWDKLNKK